MAKISSYCYDVNYAERLLGDFSIRRLKLLRQDIADQVILWMVVLITISGVMLAALQLLISYRFASDGKRFGPEETRLDVDVSGKVALKSSITGLVILLISFGFFFLFVKDVYQIKEIDLDRRNASEIKYSAPVGPQISGGQPNLPVLPSPPPRASLPVAPKT
jgi:hypothetical protein